MATEKEKLVVINKQLRLGEFLDSVLCNFFKHMVYRVMEKALDLGLGEVGSSPHYAIGCVTWGKTLMGLPHFKVVSPYPHLSQKNTFRASLTDKSDVFAQIFY